MNSIQKTVLVIDDEPQIRRFMKASLSAEGYAYVDAENGQNGIHQAAVATPDLIILDLGLPDLDGFEVLQSIRQWSQVPILILTARDEELEKVRLLKGGANDYITKPFGISELMARIYVLLRDVGQPSAQNQPVLNFGMLKIDREQRQVWLNSTLISLSKKEYALLNYLASNANKLVTQEQLLIEVWGRSHREDTHYLRIFISQLRKKLHDNIIEPKFIETEPGVGYRFLLTEC